MNAKMFYSSLKQPKITIASGKYKVVMVRHGESIWNQKNLFCGWYDSKLSQKGKQEACNAGKAILNASFKFDLAFTSVLTRAHETLNIIRVLIDQHMPIKKTWRLNERHYGALTGLNKSETAAKYGEKQVAIWRRSYDKPPPAMEPNHPYYLSIVNDPRYKNGPPSELFPKYESLKLTCERTLPYWKRVIVPEIIAGKSVLIVAHGNSLRGIVKHLDNISDESIMELNLPTGIPFVYSLGEDLSPEAGGSLQFLADANTVKQAIEKVASQGKAKK